MYFKMKESNFQQLIARIMKRIIFLFIALLVSTNLLKAQDLATSKLDSLFTVMETYGKGMGSVSIFQNGKEIYQKSYGYSDVEKGFKNSANTKFRIGSVSKTFTATIIMKLIEEGKLSLTSKLSKYYPMIPNSDRITIKHLLQHRSGIFNFTKVEDYEEWRIKKQTKKQFMDRIISQEPSFKPDEKFGYSNSNYVLLTYIAEDVSSKSFSDLLNELILIPCDLRNTYIGGIINSTKGEAYSYIKMSSKWKKTNETDMTVPLGSGFIVSNPYDLNVFFNYLFSGRIVNKKNLDSMLLLKDNFGLGLFKFSFLNNIGYGHTGGIDGFQSNVFYFPEIKLSIALVENGVAYMLSNIVSGCLSIYLGKDYKLPAFSKAIELTPEELDKYLGMYSSPELPMKLLITKKENILIVQVSGQKELPLECIASNIFQYEGVDLILEFDTKKNQMILKQLGNVIEMTKE